MSFISVFDIFKIGVGPSSSHTMGPWIAAKLFVNELPNQIDRIEIKLYGSLSKTGKGHATDKAVILGLMGKDPKSINTTSIPSIIKNLESNQVLQVGNQEIGFNPSKHISFEKTTHPLHPNTMKFFALKNNEVVFEKTYLSVGGGFIEDPESADEVIKQAIPYPIENGKDLIGYTNKQDCKISQVVLKNELALQNEGEVVSAIQSIIDTMFGCVYRGCQSVGTLPGGLNVKRRAQSIFSNLTGDKDFSDLNEWMDIVKKSRREFKEINLWVSCFALAVNEENAAMGRVVTSPTNGAAGVIPAVLLYYLLLSGEEPDSEKLIDFILVAGEVGSLFKKGATISAAVGGCQAEIGVSSAMAAAGLTEVLGGSPS